MRRIVWSDDALTEFDAAVAYVAQDNPTAATALLDKIDASVRSLADMPVGRPGRVSGTYEKPVVGTAYMVAYHLAERTITILRVIHGRRDWPQGGWPD